MALRLNTIIVSTRPTRVGPIFAEWFHGLARSHGRFEPHLVDLAEFGLPVLDEPKHPRLQDYQHEHTRAWSRSVASADAFVFVTPEYNYGAPPSFVNAVDYLYREWAYKPAGFVSYGGVSGGLRAVQAEKPVLTTVNVMPIPQGVSIPNFAQHLDSERRFKPTDLMVDGAKSMLDALHRWAEALKPMRD